jgi:hypothetical protein
MRVKAVMTPDLPEGDYPFIDRTFPLSELSMIEVPPDLERLLQDQAEQAGNPILRNAPVRLRCITDQYGDATFLIWWPDGVRMHMLAPKRFAKGLA